jgi:hypothetical protein
MSASGSLCWFCLSTTPSFSEGWGDRQGSIPKLNEAGERYWITMLVEELNRELRFGLAKVVSVGRTLLAVRRQECGDG